MLDQLAPEIQDSAFEILEAQPIAHGGLSLRALLRWATGIAGVAVVIALAFAWLPSRLAHAAPGVTLFLTTDHGVTALHSTTGGVQWTQATTGLLLAANQAEIVLERDDTTIVEDTISGRTLWQSSAADAGDPVAVIGDTVYSVPSAPQRQAGMANVLLARDLATGALRWRVTLPASVRAAVASDGDRVIVGGMEADSTATFSAITAYAARTGAQLWQVTLPATWYTVPQLAGDQVIVQTRAAVYALAATTGERQWSIAAQVTTTPVVAGARVYLATPGALIASSLATGHALWRAPLTADLTTPPVVTDNWVALQLPNTFMALDPVGAVRWQATGQEQYQGAFLVAGDLVYFQDAQGVTAYTWRTGTWRWHAALAGSAGTTPALVGNFLYVARGATLYALDAATGAQRWRQTLPGTPLTPALSAVVSATSAG